MASGKIMRGLLGVLFLWCWLAFPAFVFAQDVAFVLSVTPQKRVSYGSSTPAAAPVLPMQVLRSGDTLRLAKGSRLAVAMVLPNQKPQRRVYLGPAHLQLKTDHIAVLEGAKAQVSPLSESAVQLIAQWQVWQQENKKPTLAHNQGAPASSALTLLSPKFDEVLLHRNPILVWQGSFPRDASLVVFDGQGKRFWSQALDEHTVEFPPALEFEWGQSYRFEVRKATGGRMYDGQFEIASETTTKDLLAERSNYLASALPEWRLLYAMRLHLARAYGQALPVWQAMGLPNPAP
jgi:hypothetical protein